MAATDQVRYGGQLYAVDGQPAYWVDLFDHDHHVQIQLRAVDG